MKDGRSNKEFYRLWWECLRRSDDYREICKWAGDGAEIEKLPSKFKRSYKTPIHSSCIPLKKIGLTEKEYSLWTPYDQMCACYEGQMTHLLSPIIKFFQYSGDIYSDSFDDWYLRMKKNVESRRDANKPILFLKDILADDFKWCIGLLEMRLGRAPSLEELQAFMINEFYTAPFKLHLVINSVGYDPKEVSDEVERIIRAHKKDHSLKEDDKRFSWCVSPVGRKQYDEIKRYLDVYDIWKERGKGRAWKGRVKERLLYYKRKVETRRQAPYEINSDIDHDRKNAVKIINNAERGIFPGEY